MILTIEMDSFFFECDKLIQAEIMVFNMLISINQFYLTLKLNIIKSLQEKVVLIKNMCKRNMKIRRINMDLYITLRFQMNSHST